MGLERQQEGEEDRTEEARKDEPPPGVACPARVAPAAALDGLKVQIALEDDPTRAMEHVQILRHSEVLHAIGRFRGSPCGMRRTSTVSSMVLIDELTAADVRSGQVWRHDTCLIPERVFEYEISEIQNERVFLRPLNGGSAAETTLGSLLAYWVPVKL